MGDDRFYRADRWQAMRWTQHSLATLLAGLLEPWVTRRHTGFILRHHAPCQCWPRHPARGRTGRGVGRRR